MSFRVYCVSIFVKVVEVKGISDQSAFFIWDTKENLSTTHTSWGNENEGIYVVYVSFTKELRSKFLGMEARYELLPREFIVAIPSNVSKRPFTENDICFSQESSAGLFVMICMAFPMVNYDPMARLANARTNFGEKFKIVAR